MSKKDKLISVDHLKWNVGGIKCGTLTVDYLNWILDHEEPAVDAVPQWIPVSEKLPDALDRVLVTSTHGHVYISYIVHGEFEYGGEVIAWMPLPKPYEGDKA